MRTHMLVLSCWIAGGGAAVAQPAALTLAALEQLALERNPTLAQAQSEVTAAQGRALQAGLWPNPSIGYTAEEVSNSPTIHGGKHGFFVEQVIPLGGKLAASRAVFDRETDAAEARHEGQRFRVLNAVRTLFYEALVAARRVEVREGLAALSSEAVEVSQQLANVGAADQTDLLAAQVEAQQTDVALVDARNDERRIWRRLAYVVGDPTLAVRPLAGDADNGPPVLDHDLSLATLLRDSPQVKAATAGVERARAALARARKEPIPDLFVRGGPRYNRELLDPGPAPVGWEFFADISARVPLWDRNQGAIAAAEADLTRAEAEVTRVELSLRSRLAELFEQYSTAARRAASYRNAIVPNAEEAHQLFLARFQEVAAAYPQVLIAQRTLFQVTEQYLEALAEAWRASVLIDGLLLEGGLESPSPGDASPGRSLGTARTRD